MLIDWFTTGAQLVNFLILVWLMKRFLYRPVLAAIAAREARISDQLSDAAAKQATALEEVARYRAKNAEFDRARAALMSEAVAQAGDEQKRLVELGRVADDAARKSRQLAMDAAEEQLCSQVTLQVRDEVFATVRYALTALADTSLEESMVHQFARRVAELGQTERAQLTSALAVDPNAAVIRSAMTLDEPLRLALNQALYKAGLAVGTLRFEVATQLICGIEFSVNGRTLAWNVDTFLKSTEQRANALLTIADTPKAARASIPQPDQNVTDVPAAPAAPILGASTAVPVHQAMPIVAALAATPAGNALIGTPAGTAASGATG